MRILITLFCLAITIPSCTKMNKVASTTKKVAKKATADSSSSGNEVIAQLGNTKITKSYLENALKNVPPMQASMVKSNPSVRKKFIDFVVSNEVFYQEALKSKLDKTDDFKSRVDFIKKDLLAQKLREKLFADKVNDVELKKYFDTNKSKFDNAEVKASHILLPVAERVKAEKILKDAQAPDADFAKLAKDNSTGPSAKNGGNLDFFKRGAMAPKFEEAAFSTAENTVHPTLVETQFGLHIIKVFEKKAGATPDFEKSKRQIEQILKREVMDSYTKDLHKKLNVTINEDVIKNLKF